MSVAGRSLDDIFEFNSTKFHPAHAAYSQALDNLFAYNDNSAKISAASSQTALNQARAVIIGASVAGLVIGIAFALVITIGLGKVLRQVASALDESSERDKAVAGPYVNEGYTRRQPCSIKHAIPNPLNHATNNRFMV